MQIIMQQMQEIHLGNLPNADEIHNHIHSLLDGKLGNIAIELAEDIGSVM